MTFGIPSYSGIVGDVLEPAIENAVKVVTSVGRVFSDDSHPPSEIRAQRRCRRRRRGRPAPSEQRGVGARWLARTRDDPGRFAGSDHNRIASLDGAPQARRFCQQAGEIESQSEGLPRNLRAEVDARLYIFPQPSCLPAAKQPRIRRTGRSGPERFRTPAAGRAQMQTRADTLPLELAPLASATLPPPQRTSPALQGRGFARHTPGIQLRLAATLGGAVRA